VYFKLFETSMTNIKKSDDDNKIKLTRVLSTKLSIDDYMYLEYLQTKHIGVEQSAKTAHLKCYDI
jgi:hypothetical protein